MDRFYECFADLPDPRSDNSSHDLMEILFIALLSSLCGATSCSDMEEFGLAKEPLLRQVLTLEHGIPSHDTFSRVFRRLDAVAFEAAFGRFMEAFGEGAKLKAPKGVEALDGKANWSRASTFCPNVFQRTNCSRLCAAIGASRMPFIGRSASPSPKTWPAIAKIMARPTWRS